MIALFYRYFSSSLLVLLIGAGVIPLSYAHDPIFGMGPHVLFKGGTEVSVVNHFEKSGEEREYELGLELVRGITGELAIGVEVPYSIKKNAGTESDGTSDISVFTK